MTFKYKNLNKSEVDVDGNAEFHFEIWQDGDLIANNGTIICNPSDFDTKFSQKCQGIVDAQTIIADIPPTGDVTL